MLLPKPAALPSLKRSQDSRAQSSTASNARHAWLDRTSLLMNAEHVTLGEADAEVELDVRFENKSAGKSGTGCVHTAPGHGADDFHVAKQYGLEIYAPVDAAGRFTSEVEHWAGEEIFEANSKIVEFCAIAVRLFLAKATSIVTRIAGDARIR